jgi:catalase
MPTADNPVSKADAGATPVGAVGGQSRNTWELLRRNPVQVLAIGIMLASTISLFAYVGGYLSPHRLSPKRMVDAFEEIGGGAHEGFRRAHAKGICVAGSFLATAEARSLSTATVFAGSPVPVIGRLAESAPNPYASDSTQSVRSMALRLQPLGAAEWRMAINDTPGLQGSTPQAFYDNLRASTPDRQTGKPDPKRIAAYLDTHLEAVAFAARMKAKPLASGFANDSYNSIDGFIFVAPDGHRQLVRWSMQAEDPFATLTPEVRTSRTSTYLFDDLLARVARGPIKWRLVATIAMPGDPNRAGEIWPSDRRQVDMGELTITGVESEAPRNCRDLIFDPLVLPPGIEPSDDPILLARSAVYSESFRRRSGEHHPLSAVANRSAGSP